MFIALITAQVAVGIILASSGVMPFAIPIAIAGMVFTDTVAFGTSCILEGSNFQDMGDYHRIFSQRTKAIRECGYQAVAEREKQPMFPKYFGKKDLFDNVFDYFYNRLCTPYLAIEAYKELIKNKNMRKV